MLHSIYIYTDINGFKSQFLFLNLWCKISLYCKTFLHLVCSDSTRTEAKGTRRRSFKLEAFGLAPTMSLEWFHTWQLVSIDWMILWQHHVGHCMQHHNRLDWDRTGEQRGCIASAHTCLKSVLTCTGFPHASIQPCKHSSLHTHIQYACCSPRETSLDKLPSTAAQGLPRHLLRLLSTLSFVLGCSRNL